MSLHRLRHNNPRAIGHVEKFQDAHRMEEGQESLMEMENPVDLAPTKRTSNIPGLKNLPLKPKKRERHNRVKRRMKVHC